MQGIGLALDDDTESASNTRQIGRATILVVERDEFTRSCLLSWLQNACPEFSVAPSTSTEQHLGTGPFARPALVILSDDPSHSDLKWIEQQSRLVRAGLPGVPVLAIVRGDKLPALTDACTRLGLQGFLPTWTAAPIAAAVLRMIVAGGTYFPLPRRGDGTTSRSSAVHAGAARLTTSLSRRELAVAELVGHGMQNKLIAYKLNISLSTVKAHVHRITRKLKVRNRTELAVLVRAPEFSHPDR
jgi:DNA-binding NarL/FixJ family response regulator